MVKSYGIHLPTKGMKSWTLFLGVALFASIR
jgi:hypothetical protein